MPSKEEGGGDGKLKIFAVYGMALYRKSTALDGWERNVYCRDGRMNHKIVEEGPKEEGKEREEEMMLGILKDAWIVESHPMFMGQ